MMNNTNDKSTDEKALHDLFQKMRDGWNQGNGQAFAASFTEDDDYIIVNGTYLKGRQAIAVAHQQLFETRFRGSQLEGFVKNIRFLSDDIALVHLHGRPQIPDQAVPAPEQYSIQSLIGIRQDDGWRFTSFQNTLMQAESGDIPGSASALKQELLDGSGPNSYADSARRMVHPRIP